MIRQAVVMARENRSNDKQLVGYIVPEGKFERDNLIAFLKNKLPEFMVPALWVELENLPLTTNGKIDKRALPHPDDTDLLNNHYVAPRTEMEKRLTDIWKELLHLKQVGIHDNFFEVGGHSLLAMRLMSGIRKQLQVELAIRDVFQFNTISALSKYIEIQTQAHSEEKGLTEFELLNI